MDIVGGPVDNGRVVGDIVILDKDCAGNVGGGAEVVIEGVVGPGAGTNITLCCAACACERGCPGLWSDGPAPRHRC